MNASPAKPEHARASVESESAPSNGGGALSVTAPIEAALERVFIQQKLPEAQRRALLRTATQEVIVAVKKSELFSGPIPHPAHFEKYELILPGSADRIIAMAERQQAHSIRWETKEINAQFILAFAGICFGFIIGMSLIGGAVYLAVLDKTTVACAMLAAGALSMATSFMRGRSLFDRHPEAEEKPTLPAPPRRRAPARKK